MEREQEANQDVEQAHFSQRRSVHVERASSGACVVGCRTSTTELSALKLGSRATVLIAGRDVYEERLCVWLISGDRWIMALRDVTRKQSCPREAEQIDQTPKDSILDS